MKNLIKLISISFVLFITQTTVAQDFKVSAYSSSSQDIGIAMTFLLPGTIGDIELGGYYETNSYVDKKGESSVRENRTSTFKGMYATLFLLGTEKLQFGTNVRFGLVNTDYVAATFALASEYSVSNNMGIGLSAVFGDELPKLEAKVTYNLSGSKNRLARQKKYKENKDYYKQLRKQTRYFDK